MSAIEELKENVKNMESLIDEIREDLGKLGKGVKKASRRVRKNLSAISKSCKASRKLSLEALEEAE